MRKSWLMIIFALLLISPVLALTDITNCTDLQAMNMTINEDYRLVNNIDCSDTINWNGGAGFEPLGSFGGSDCLTGGTGEQGLNATFDGQGYNITDLYFNDTSGYIGLFECIQPNGLIKNLNLIDVTIYSTSASGTAPLSAGYSYGDVENVKATGNIMGTNDKVAGLVADIGGNLVNSSFEGIVRGDDKVGGLSWNVWGNMTNSYAKADLLVTGHEIGGITALNYWTQGHIDNCYFEGLINSTGAGEYYIGALVGDNQESILNNSWAIADVYTASDGSYNGLMVGNDASGIIQNSYAVGSIYSGDYIGGIIGYTYGTFIDNVNVTITKVSGNDYVGGLIGYNDVITTKIKRVKLLGSEIEGNDYVGGIVGYNEDVAMNGLYISPTTKVTGANYVGGIVGYLDSGNITNSWSAGNVTGTNYVGGFAGYNNNLIQNGLSIGKVIGTTHTGGLVGNGTGTCPDSYWDNILSGQDNSYCGTAKTTEELIVEDTFQNWDFVGTWQYQDYCLPALLGQDFLYCFFPEITPPVDRPIYDILNSGGAGLGLLFIYLSQALPILLIVLTFVAIIVIVGIAVAKAIKMPKASNVK